MLRGIAVSILTILTYLLFLPKYVSPVDYDDGIGNILIIQVHTYLLSKIKEDIYLEITL